jgi:hypothetical protein
VNAGQDQLSVQIRAADRRRQAEDWLADASYRLHQAKLEALIGVRYDSDDYDRLVLEYRHAKRRADAMRQLTRLLKLGAARNAQPSALPAARAA